MNKKLAVIAIITGLAGCSSDDPTANLESTLTHILLNGTWASACRAEAPNSVQVNATLKDGNGSLIVTTFTGTTTCAPSLLTTVEPETFTYTIGSDVTVDGSVAGITTATQVDSVNATVGSPDIGSIEYDIFAITNLITLYIGDDSGVNDGSTAALRPTKLLDLPFTKQ